MDRRHHDGRPHRRPVWRRHRASSPRCRVALGPAHGGRLVQERGGRQLAPARHGLRATRPLPCNGRRPAHVGAARSARHLPHLRHAGTDDLLHQRAPVDGLPQAQLHLRRRVGVRRLVGEGPQDRGAGPDDPVLRGTALRRRRRRRALDGDTAALSNGLRYPVPPYGIQSDAGAGLAVSYATKETRA